MPPDDAYFHLLQNMPPFAPADDEVPLDFITDAAVSRRVSEAKQAIREVGSRIDRVVLTTSPKFGEVWRVDSVSNGRPTSYYRHMATKEGTFNRPLEMFDPKQNIPRLPTGFGLNLRSR
jgi:hypothetical protein